MATLTSAPRAAVVAHAPFVRCGDELFPVGSAYPIGPTVPASATVGQVVASAAREAKRTDDVVIAVDRVVVAPPNAPARLIAYRYTLANGEVFYQTIPTVDARVKASEEAFFRAGGLKGHAWVFRSPLPASMPLNVNESVLASSGAAIEPCTQ